MTEISRPFQDGVGDGGPYSATEWHKVLETLALAVGANTGVVRGILNELVVTSSGATNITVDTGRAIAQGILYENDASESKVTADPGGAGTTGRRCVLRVDYSARTVRIAIISSAQDVTDLPALTQVAGVTWEIPLAGFQVTNTTGAITELTDERAYTLPIAVPRYVSRAGLERWSVPGWWFGSGTAGANPAADVITFIPIFVPVRRTYDRIGLGVTTDAAGEVMRLGIYSASVDADGITPDKLIVQTAAVSVAAVVEKEETIDQTLGPGWYFLAHVDESGTPRYQRMDVAGSIVPPVVGHVPSPSSGFGGRGIILLTDANPGADWPNVNGLPAAAPAVTGVDYPGGLAPLVLLRDSS